MTEEYFNDHFSAAAAAAWQEFEAAVDALAAPTTELDAEQSSRSQRASEALTKLYRGRSEEERRACVDRMAHVFNNMLARSAANTAEASWRAALAALAGPDFDRALLDAGAALVAAHRVGGRTVRDLARELVDAVPAEQRGDLGGDFDSAVASLEEMVGILSGAASLPASTLFAFWMSATPGQAAAVEAMLPPEPAAAAGAAIQDPEWQAFLAEARSVRPEEFERHEARLGGHVGRLMDGGHDARVILIEWAANLPRLARGHWAARIETMAPLVAEMRRRSRGHGGAASVAGAYARSRAAASPAAVEEGDRIVAASRASRAERRAHMREARKRRRS